MDKKDYFLACLSGILSGLLVLPVLKAINFEHYLKYKFYIFILFIVGTLSVLAITKYISTGFPTLWQIGKFGVIGVLNTLVDFAFLTLLTVYIRYYINVEPNFKIIYDIPVYSFYKSTSFLLAVVNSYFWNKYWAFSDGVLHRSRPEFLQFLLVSIIGLGINVGVSTYVFNYIKLAEFNIDQMGLCGAGFGSLLGLGWNFVGYKFIVFKK